MTDFPLPFWLMAPLVYALWVGLGMVVKKSLYSFLHHLTKKTQTQVDDILVEAINWPLIIMIFVSGAVVVYELFLSQFSDLAKHALLVGFKAISILTALLFLNTFLIRLIRFYSSTVAMLRVSQGFTEVIVRLIIFTLGGLILLDTLGFSITPIVASLGIGSLAVALALQPTFENIFSGFQIILDQPVVPGQLVKLESGEEGIVEKVGWRSTWIRQLANNMVIIPNKQLINSRIINYEYPSKETAVVVSLGVHYSSNLDKVERVTLEVAREILKKVEGGIPEFEPLVRFHNFNNSSLDFNVILRAQTFLDSHTLKHEFIKALIMRYSKEDIVIPYPITAINTSQERASEHLNLRN